MDDYIDHEQTRQGINSLSHSSSPLKRTEKFHKYFSHLEMTFAISKDLKPTQVGFACVDAVSNRPFN